MTQMSAAEYRRLRKSLGLTQVQLAHRLAIDPSTVSKRERGEVAIDSEAARAIQHLVNEEAA